MPSNGALADLPPQGFALVIVTGRMTPAAHTLTGTMGNGPSPEDSSYALTSFRGSRSTYLQHPTM